MAALRKCYRVLCLHIKWRNNMQIPKLDIPSQMNGPTTSVLANASELKAWINILPLANGPEPARLLVEILSGANRCAIVAQKRFRGLEMLRPAISITADMLKKEYRNAPLPLSSKNALLSELTQQLFAETAIGYKILIIETLLGQKQLANPYEYFIPSLYHAMTNLGEILLECYTIYAPEPANLWRELHQLYLYAECAYIDQLSLKLDPPSAAESSISDLYRRIIMLALANPYHLIPGEANKVFHTLKSWAKLCNIVSCAATTPPLGSYFVDLATDSPPIFSTKATANKKLAEGRLIDTGEVVDHVMAEIEKMKSASLQLKDRHSTLPQRAQRDMYTRVLKGWRSRAERKSPRSAHPTDITIVTGLTACHFALSEGNDFSPEKDEMALRKTTDSGRAIGLVSNAQKPWQEQVKAEELEAGGEPTLPALFESGSVVADDVWQKVYFGTAQRSSIRDERMAAKHLMDQDPAKRSVLCKITNTSNKGMALVFGLDTHRSQTRVGDIAAIKTPTNNKAGYVWSIAATRWLRTSADDKVELGIEILCDDAVPIAVKALEGVGRGGEYFRALLIPRTEAYARSATIIGPPAIYDVDSVLIMNTTHKLMRLRLTKVLEETSSYARFDFKMLPV